MKKLAGKVTVITGASRGFGKAMAILFAKEGAKVVLASRLNEEIHHLAQALQMKGHTAASIACDVSKLEEVEKLANFAIQTYGQFDIWINNAGTAGPYGATYQLSHEQFEKVLNTNIFGTYYGSIMAMRHFLPRSSGKLINILGAGSKKPAPRQNAYGSTKAWIRVFTLALAAESKASGVGVFALQPGLMNTDLLTELVTFQEHEARLQNFMPFLVRAGSKNPEIAARRALWLASSATDGRTGLDVRVGSSFSVMLGFIREGVRQLLHLPAHEIPVNVKVIPSAFKPLEK
jgi:glucose 1-dehydrogenase